MTVESEMVAVDAVGAAPLPLQQPTRRPAGVVRVNLIPPEIGEAKRLRSVQVAVGAGVVAVLAGVALVYVQQAHAVDDAQSKLATAQAQNTSLQAEQSRLGNVNALYAQVDAAQAMLKTAQAPQVLWSRYLQDLRLKLPERDWLTSVTLAEAPAGTTSSTTGTAAAAAAAGTSAGSVAACAPVGSIGVMGGGYTHRDVANWLTRLAGIKGVVNPYLTTSTEVLAGKTLPMVTWSSTASLSCSALASSTTATTGGN